jgi:hypothetical protein
MPNKPADRLALVLPGRFVAGGGIVEAGLSAQPKAPENQSRAADL